MRYESNTKVARNNKIVQYRKDHPELSLEEIANRFGISKQRVYQILKKD